MGVWIGSVQGDLKELEGIAVNPLLDAGVRWLPDQQRLLIRRVPERGPPPRPPAIPAGPKILEGEGRPGPVHLRVPEPARDGSRRRPLLLLRDLRAGRGGSGQRRGGAPGRARGLLRPPTTPRTGRFLLVERLVGPWSHAVPWWRFAHEVEVWDADGQPVATIASLPLADEVPIHGYPTRAARRLVASHGIRTPCSGSRRWTAATPSPRRRIATG